MKVPLIATAQATMLAEGLSHAAPPTPDLPSELRPRLDFSDEQIRAALPLPGRFGRADLRIG